MRRLDRLTAHLGGYQSDHTRQVAAVAAKLERACVLVREKWVDWPDAVNDRVGNIPVASTPAAIRLTGQPALNAYSDLFTTTQRRPQSPRE